MVYRCNGVRCPKDDLASAEERRTLNSMKATTYFSNGQYTTGLIWRQDIREKIEDYIQKRYAHELTGAEMKQTPSKAWYIPIFPHSSPNKPGKSV